MGDNPEIGLIRRVDEAIGKTKGKATVIIMSLETYRQAKQILDQWVAEGKAEGRWRVAEFIELEYDQPIYFFRGLKMFSSEQQLEGFRVV